MGKKKKLKDKEKLKDSTVKDSNKNGDNVKTKDKSADKVKKKNKNRTFQSSKPKFGNTIWTTLMGGLLLAIVIIMAITFTISIGVVNSAQYNSLTDFYQNAFDISVKNLSIQKQVASNVDFKELKIEVPIKDIIKSNTELIRLRNEMNSKQLMLEYAVKDIFVVDGANNPVFTTLNKGEYKYLQDGMTPLVITKYSDYTLVTIQKTFMKKEANGSQSIDKSKSYTAYFAVPRLTAKYRTQVINQLTQISIFIILVCMFCLLGLVRSITKPLDTMEKTVSQIAKGDLSGRLNYTKYEEINKLVGSYNMMANALQRLYSSLESQVNDRTTELKGAYAELQSTQAMMVHSEKMKSLGELVAGIMHEINNPINFIYGNMTHLGNYSNDLIEIIDEYTKYEPALNNEAKTQISKKKEECDYEFLKTDMPDLIKSCKEGAERAKNIIQDLKSFSRMEEVSIKDVDLPAEIDTVLNILHNKIKNKAEVHKEYMENVPKVEAFGGQLNQVFMNILDNAVGAIEQTGDIWIRMNTDKDKNNLVIEIEDNGAGMDEETQKKVFDPFFTTKPVGKGTGLGMSITYKIIKNHQGDINVISKKGQGTKFIVTLPLNIDREKLKASVATGEGEGQNG